MSELNCIIFPISNSRFNLINLQCLFYMVPGTVYYSTIIEESVFDENGFMSFKCHIKLGSDQKPLQAFTFARLPGIRHPPNLPNNAWIQISINVKVHTP